MSGTKNNNIPPNENLVKIDISRVIQNNFAICDIYLHTPSDHVVLMAKKGDSPKQEFIQKVDENYSTTMYFCIDKNEYNHLMNKKISTSAQAMIAYLKKNDSAATNKATPLVQQMCGVNIIRKYLSQVGVDDTIITLAESTLNSVYENYTKSPMIKSILYEIIGKDDFFHQKALAMSYLITFILSKLPIGTERNRRNMLLAALCHDFSVKDKQYLTYRNMRDVPQSLSFLDTFNNYLEHPDKEAEILSLCPEIPLDVINFVKDHHFPVANLQTIVKFADIKPDKRQQIFNISHDLALHMINNSAEKKSISEFFYTYNQKAKYHCLEMIRKFGHML